MPFHEASKIETSFSQERMIKEGISQTSKIKSIEDDVVYNASRITNKERQRMIMECLDQWSTDPDLRLPGYYYDNLDGSSKSNDCIRECLSIAEDIWPVEAALQQVQKLKKAYIDPEDLAERLRKLKPSDNFELCEYPYNDRISWSITPLQFEGIELGEIPGDFGLEASPPSLPYWAEDQIHFLRKIERKMGASFAIHRRQIEDRCATVTSSVERIPLPGFQFLREMEHSPGGTLFPWYLVQGLLQLREEANKRGRDIYERTFDGVESKRKDKIECWKKRNLDAVLEDGSYYYHTLPVDLRAELEELDREALRCGREEYAAVLEEAQAKMYELVGFWESCGLINGRRSPPSYYSQLMFDTAPNTQSRASIFTTGDQMSCKQKDKLLNNTSGPYISRDECHQIQKRLSKGADRRTNKIPTDRDCEMRWHGKLRPRPGTLNTSGAKAETKFEQIRKPVGVLKRKQKKTKDKIQAAPKAQAALPNPGLTDPPHPFDSQSRFNKSVRDPGDAINTRKRTFRPPPMTSSKQSKGIQKARSSNQMQNGKAVKDTLTNDQKDRLARIVEVVKVQIS